MKKIKKGGENIFMAQKKNTKIISQVRSSESTISLALGILVVLVAGFFLFKYFKKLATKPNESQVNEGATETQEEKQAGETGEEQKTLPTKYIVQKGDNLWKISLKFYGSGYNWVDISRQNNLKNPGLIEEGEELQIPNVPAKKPVLAKTNQEVNQPITGNSYTVVKGDNLWNISVRAYQDGYKWTEIAKANRLVNPGLIHPGNQLVIPR